MKKISIVHFYDKLNLSFGYLTRKILFFAYLGKKNFKLV